ANPDELIHKLEQSHELEVVSSSSLTAAIGRPAKLRASSAPCLLSVQFAPAVDSSGKTSLHVRPEITLENGGGVETRRLNADLPEGGSFLVRGLLNDPEGAKILSRLYPGHAWNDRELIIFVNARAAQTSSPAVAQTSRER